MLKATKKVYMSILAILLVFITVVATTFAWVGILTYAQTDNFKMNLKIQDLQNEFYLSISATDEEGIDSDGNPYTTYGETADEYEIKKQIITNMTGRTFTNENEQMIDKIFYDNYEIYPSTVTKESLETKTDDFRVLNAEAGARTLKSDKHSYYKFDVYLSMEHRSGEITSETNQKMDLILADIANTLTGDTSNQTLANDFTYPSSNIYNPNQFGTISGEVNVNAASAARLALAIYEPIDRTSKYTGNENPDRVIIYQGGTKYPTYNSVDNTYSFGGILPEEYNLALYEHKKNKHISDAEFNPEDMVNREDYELTEENEINRLFDDNYGFGVFNGVKKKVKITIYFWFEGWDADCFEIIDAVKVRINLNFATNSDEQQN